MLRELGHRKYRQALDKLERLVVQRLFEMSKLGLNGTGYKLREKLGKALKARATAIKKAITDYNARAKELIPPRPTLAWSDIVDMSTVADFDLLRDTRQDIRELPWAQPLNRRAMNLYFNIKRAREEVQRLNVEIPRLISSMLDEHVDLYCAVAASLITNPSLAHELSRQWQYQHHVSVRIAQHLRDASQLPGFSGTLVAGRRRRKARRKPSSIT
ncbi:hypothetical protein BV20DRAFT_1035214 [Pilatotrama ljubarskyi]|nr:hypothetical protein BV20DRAFT_1035214 [Pilatotrama ljubarskyi]